MKTSKVSSYTISAVMLWLINSCAIGDQLNPRNKIRVTGQVVARRSSVPVAGASVKTYKTLFNCGSLCSTYQLVDSTVTDTNGNFSFNASQMDLEISIVKKGYFGLFPGSSGLTQRTQPGNNDYKVIPLKPLSTIIINYVNSVSDQDSLSNEYYACGERVNTGVDSPNRSGKEYTFERSVEGNCTIDVYTTVYRKGIKTQVKNSFYVAQGETAYKTIVY